MTDAALAERRVRLRLLSAASAFAALIVVAIVAFGPFAEDPEEGASRTPVDGGTVRGVRQTAALLRGVERHGTTLGRPDAPVTILTISDLKCPACARHSITTQNAIVERFVRTGRANLRLELVNFRDPARGTTDGAAARRAAYRLAPSDRYWPFVQTLFWNQGRTEAEWATEKLLRDVASVAPGVGLRGFSDREDAGVRASLAAADGLARRLGTDATPSVYVLRRGTARVERVEAFDDADAVETAVDRASSPPT